MPDPKSTDLKGGQDPTREAPGGSRTETRITGESPLGGDNASDGAPTGPGKRERVSPAGRRRTHPDDAR